MAPDEELRSSSMALLVLVALRGPSSPYDLKRALAGLAANFWSVPHTQVYQETARLAADGLLSVTRTEAGRRRQTYELTDRGRAAIAGWFDRPTPAGMEIRDEAQLKLLAAELASTAQIQRLAEEQVRLYRSRLDALNAAEARASTDPDRSLRYLAVPLGQAVIAAALRFWESVAADPPAI